MRRAHSPSPSHRLAVFNHLQYYRVETRLCLTGDEDDAHVRLKAVRSRKTRSSSEGNRRARRTHTVGCLLYSGNDLIVHTGAVRWRRPRSARCCLLMRGLPVESRLRRKEGLKVPLEEVPASSLLLHRGGLQLDSAASSCGCFRLENNTEEPGQTEVQKLLFSVLESSAPRSRRPCHSRSADRGSSQLT